MARKWTITRALQQLEHSLGVLGNSEASQSERERNVHRESKVLLASCEGET